MSSLFVFTSGAWVPLTFDGVAGLGINAAPDTSNRLAVKTDAVLFSHDDVTPGSGDIRQAIIRQMAGSTSSVVFSTAYEAGGEFGLIGTDDFEIKLSPDGAAWTTGLALAAAEGRISLPAGFCRPRGYPGRPRPARPPRHNSE